MASVQMEGSGIAVNLRFYLTAEQQMHIFAQWREQNPKEDIEGMKKSRWKEIMQEMLEAHGGACLTAKLPNAVEIKKIDYKAILKGIAPHY